MRAILYLSALMLALAVIVPRYLSRPAAVSTTVAAAVPPSVVSRSVMVSPGRGGHFEINGTVDGRRMEFLVDTGASTIALREQDAAKLGVYPSRSAYTMRVSTANGIILAAPVELHRVEVGDITVRNVAALVLPDAALSQNLLGMSFLSRVHWQYQGGRLMLEQ